VLELASTAIEALGVSIGCLHSEIKLTPDGPRVIELNGRIGGGVPEMLLDATGVDLMQIALRLALGEEIVFSTMPSFSKVGYLLYVHAPFDMRRVAAVNGLDGLRAGAAVEESFSVAGRAIRSTGARATTVMCSPCAGRSAITPSSAHRAARSCRGADRGE